MVLRHNTGIETLAGCTPSLRSRGADEYIRAIQHLANNMIKETIVKYTLEEKDLNTIKECLNYCYHRASQHKTPMTGREDEINRLRKEFGIIK